MRKPILLFFLLFSNILIFSQSGKVDVIKNNDGWKLEVNGNDFIIKGMNWDYYPIGTNFTYNLWAQPDDFIKTALDEEMGLLKNMGVNTIRQYTGIPPKWIQYIYENFGIYTVLNHSFGRYGLTIKNNWVPNTDYSDARTKALLLKETKEMVNQYKNTPGLLMFLLGNENNYGLFWRGAETENVPFGDRKSTKDALYLYQLFNEAAVEMKSIDASHPVAICNGDLLFLDIIKEKCKDIDVLGINSYRGKSFTDLFSKVKTFDKPIMFTEFGSDAYNELSNKEDQKDQANYLVNNWREIYENVAGLGKAENTLGGFTFQFSDGWWKTGQTTNLDVHDTSASWSNGGYLFDFKNGDNNMNEEWFGICAKGPTDQNGHYELFPRAAYYALKQVHSINPLKQGNNIESLGNQFNDLNIIDSELRARADQASLAGKITDKLYLSDMRAEFSTYNTGGNLITTPKIENSTEKVYPNKLGFDHMESFYIGATAKPAPNVNANVQFNILGHVAENPIDEIFYENRGRKILVETPTGIQEIDSNNRIQLYRASFNWNSKIFDLTGFYRTGHYHWGYEGDFFGLYPEANYGPNIDIYNGEAPVGIELAGKKALSGLKVAYGPQLWWGANPAILVKYSKKIEDFNLTGIYHEDLEQRSGIESSFAIPQPKTRRVTVALDRNFGKFGFNLGGIWAGQPLNGRTFQLLRENKVYQDQIKSEDNFGGKIKFTYTGGNINWYGQAAYMGLVANGGADYTQTFTGWRLKDSGSGNQYNFLTGLTFLLGNLQVAPNFLWQKPIEGPIPMGVSAPGRPRNILDDPFSVRINRETVAGELLLTYDPTPATWFYAWDNDRTEDAPFAINTDFIYRHLPTTQDAAIGISQNGRTAFAFPGAAPAKDLWEVNTRMVSKVNSNLGVIANLYFGNGQANGSDPRTIDRFGMDLRSIYKKVKLIYAVKFNDWGPYDYHKDYNLTYPFQTMLDLSTEVGKPDWFILPGTRIGIRGTYRTLNQYSPRYFPTSTVNADGMFVPDPKAIGFPYGNEWEIRTYIQINIGK